MQQSQDSSSNNVSTSTQNTEESTEIKPENIQPVKEEKTSEVLAGNAETSVTATTSNPISEETQIIVPKSEEDIKAEYFKKVENLKRPNLMAKYKFLKGSRTKITHHIFRKIFCSICQAQVHSIDKLAIHLDREHKIRVDEESAPRIIDADERLGFINNL